jgi:hypothetical protein
MRAQYKQSGGPGGIGRPIGGERPAGDDAAMDREALDRLLAGLRASAGDEPGEPGARAERRARGVFFTPPPLAAFVARQVLAPCVATATWTAGVPDLRVLDPAAGDGRFLAAALDVLAEAAAERGPVDRVRLAGCLIGVERDPALAAAAEARLPGAAIQVGEAITGSHALGLAEVDAVVGNPPYVRSIRLRRADPALWTALRGRLEATSHGEWDLYAAFVEQALTWVRPGGRVGLVVPSRWMTASFAGRLRGLLAGAGAVRAVVDFGSEQVFPGATTYASVIVLERAPAAAAIPVARLAAAGWETGAVAPSSLGAAPWRFAVGAAARACEAAATRGPRLGDVARIAKGAGTNADGVYVIERAIVDGELVHGTSAGGAITVERAATRPCLRGRDVVPWDTIDVGAAHTRCIVPYRGDRLVPWGSLVERWPRAAAHLEAQRPRLEAREDGRFTGTGFHAFGRPQNLRFHADPAPKVVVPDVARVGRAMIDDQGAMVLDSAYALRPRADAGTAVDPHLLLLVLDSPMVALWLSWAGVPLRGGYVRLKTAYLAPLPLPAPGPRLDAAVAMAAAGDRAGARAALGEAYGIDGSLWIDAAATPRRTVRA